jgi:hypothetical protein
VGVPVYYPRKRVGFDFVPLKWKTKFGDTDYIFEWAPVMSFVFFKWQIAAVIQAPLTEDFAYWEAWLYYTRDTDKSKSTQERVKQCREQFSLTYIKGDGITEQKVDYYPEVLKSEYV